ncbi:hypothetical protein ACIP1X_09230 [Pseudomonas sp. NPDC088885]|uniref:hypothetical protein n=1 Tax=Pseudomonas sp. NPDC088885 TaxID=3364457 RepID=UPI003821CE8A
MNTPRETNAPTLPPPTIRTPQTGAQFLTKKIPVSGTSTLKPPAKVWVYFHKGWWEPNSQFEVREDGTWGGILDWKFAMPYGSNSIVARHELGMEYSEDTAPVTFTIKLPVVQFTHPPEDGYVDQGTAFTGTGQPGSDVTVVMADNESRVLGTGPVYSSYEWAVGGGGDIILDPGKTCVKALSRMNGESVWTESHCFFVRPPQPIVRLPRSGEVESEVEVSGLGHPGALMEAWLIDNPSVSLGKGVVKESWEWSIPVQLPAGDCVIEVVQTFNEVASIPSASRSYQVK